MALAYTAPTWQNGGGVGISASQLQMLSNCMEGLVQGSDKAITDISISEQIITLTFADGSQETATASGLKGISSIAKTGTSGLVDTYTITYTDGSTSTFTVTNGAQGETGPQGPQGPQGIQGPAGADGQDGADGISPEITITTITGGHAVEITDAEHPEGQTFDVMNGENGTDGTDGISPNVSITTIPGGHRVNITDATHPQGQDFDVMDGLGAGDMLASVYDADSAVANAGGIPAYVSAHSGIDGSTVTPVGDIATWLACANLHQTYTTLSAVLADSAVLEALMNSTNAVDYLVRSTTWASTICANETAMNCIGVNDYCADTLLADSTWTTVISNSAYWKEVLNPLVPIKSSSNQSGVSADAYYSNDMLPYKAFDGDVSTMWASSVKATTTSGAWIQYDFGKAVKVYKSKTMPEYTVIGGGYQLNGAKKYYISASNDNINFTPISEEVTTNNALEWSEISFACNEAYRYWRCQITKIETPDVSFIAPSLRELQFYGRGKQPVVDTKADISAIGTEEAGATASKSYTVGDHFYKNGKFCTAIASIASGATFTLNTNYIEGTIADYIKPQYELLVSTNTVGWVQKTVNNLNLYRYIRLAIHGATGGEINSNLMPMDLFKTFVSDQAPVGVVSNESGVKYGLAFYISNTSIKVYSNGNVFKIYGIK